jgi:hypothetical protein
MLLLRVMSPCLTCPSWGEKYEKYESVLRAHQRYGVFIIGVARRVVSLQARQTHTSATINALRRDLLTITTMLQRVQ